MSFTAQDLYSIAHEAERVAAIDRRVFDPGLVSFGANVRRLVEEYAYEKSARVAEQADIQTARSEIDQLKSEIARLRNERAASERVTDKHTARKAAELAGSGYKYSGYILQNEKGERVFIEMGAVRWIDNKAMWQLMHPGPKPVEREPNTCPCGTSLDLCSKPSEAPLCGKPQPELAVPPVKFTEYGTSFNVNGAPFPVEFGNLHDRYVARGFEGPKLYTMDPA